MTISKVPYSNEYKVLIKRKIRCRGKYEECKDVIKTLRDNETRTFT